MAPSRIYPHNLKFTVAAIILIFTLTFLPSRSVGSLSSSRKQKKLVLGSSPPSCVNKCLSCRPCIAALVVPPHQKKAVRESSHREDDSYYLLSWRCRCGDKLFHP